MKKICLIVLAAVCLLLPAAGMAQGLPDFIQAVQTGLSEGLAVGAAQTAAAMDKDLTLEISAQESRVEEGQTVVVTVTAQNPRPIDAEVSLTLALPERLALDAGQQSAWEATLPAAQMDENGTLQPSTTTFTRNLTLMPGGKSEQTMLSVEMNVGTRFYRAKMPMQLCVADVSAIAAVQGGKAGRANIGDTLVYALEIRNAGAADKNVPVDLVLPMGVELVSELPEGFTQSERRVTGEVCARAAQNGEPTSMTLTWVVKAADNALDGDADAMRLLTGTLRVDGKRVAVPRIQLCSARISARLLPQAESLEAGEEMALNVVVVNAGLAAADVRVSCVLPEGISLVTEEQKESGAEEDEAEKEQSDEKTAVPLATDDSAKPQAEAVMAEHVPEEPEIRMENDTLVFDLHMDAAEEQDGAVDAHTRVVRLRVRADEPQENVREKLLGATLAWQTNHGDTQLGEAVAMRVYRPMVLGLTREEWTGILWAGLLLVVTVSCLFAAFNAENRREERGYD